jgi:hypothetical protein
VFVCVCVCLCVCVHVHVHVHACQEDLNCSDGPGCLHTDDRLRTQAREGRAEGGQSGSGGGADDVTDGHEIVTDVLALASCDALVGTMTSQVCVCVCVCGERESECA